MQQGEEKGIRRRRGKQKSNGQKMSTVCRLSAAIPTHDLSDTVNRYTQRDSSTFAHTYQLSTSLRLLRDRNQPLRATYDILSKKARCVLSFFSLPWQHCTQSQQSKLTADRQPVETVVLRALIVQQQPPLEMWTTEIRASIGDSEPVMKGISNPARRYDAMRNRNVGGGDV